MLNEPFVPLARNVLVGLMSLWVMSTAAATSPSWMPEALKKAESNLQTKYGEAQKLRGQRGLKQVAQFWRETDGDAATFASFTDKYFAGDAAAIDALFQRYERLLEQLSGHLNKLTLEFKWQIDLDLGPIQPVDELFAAYDPGAHVNEDLFQNQLAFVVLLNFPLTTLPQRLDEGPGWSRRQWAETRLAHRFAKRIPAEVNQAMAEASAKADQYVSEYNLWMHHLLAPDGSRLFPAKLRLLSHWNLRDEIKAEYSEGPNALPKQRLIQQAMERIVTQTIPAVVINNPEVDWDPVSNEVKATAVKDAEAPASSMKPVNDQPEPGTRYAIILSCFQAARKMDPYSPTAPTLIDRRFQEDREIPEARAREMLEAVLTAPVVAEVARLIEVRLGRPWNPSISGMMDFSRAGLIQRNNWTK